MLARETRRTNGVGSAAFALLALALLVAGCKGGSISGAAGNQVDPRGGSGMQRDGGMNRDNNGGGGY